MDRILSERHKSRPQDPGDGHELPYSGGNHHLPVHENGVEYLGMNEDVNAEIPWGPFYQGPEPGPGRDPEGSFADLVLEGQGVPTARLDSPDCHNSVDLSPPPSPACSSDNQNRIALMVDLKEQQAKFSISGSASDGSGLRYIGTEEKRNPGEANLDPPAPLENTDVHNMEKNRSVDACVPCRSDIDPGALVICGVSLDNGANPPAPQGPVEMQLEAVCSTQPMDGSAVVDKQINQQPQQSHQQDAVLSGSGCSPEPQGTSSGGLGLNATEATKENTDQGNTTQDALRNLVPHYVPVAHDPRLGIVLARQQETPPSGMLPECPAMAANLMIGDEVADLGGGVECLIYDNQVHEILAAKQPIVYSEPLAGRGLVFSEGRNVLAVAGPSKYAGQQAGEGHANADANKGVNGSLACVHEHQRLPFSGKQCVAGHHTQAEQPLNEQQISMWSKPSIRQSTLPNHPEDFHLQTLNVEPVGPLTSTPRERNVPSANGCGAINQIATGENRVGMVGCSTLQITGTSHTSVEARPNRSTGKNLIENPAHMEHGSSCNPMVIDGESEPTSSGAMLGNLCSIVLGAPNSMASMPPPLPPPQPSLQETDHRGAVGNKSNILMVPMGVRDSSSQEPWTLFPETLRHACNIQASRPSSLLMDMFAEKGKFKIVNTVGEIIRRYTRNNHGKPFDPWSTLNPRKCIEEMLYQTAIRRQQLRDAKVETVRIPPGCQGRKTSSKVRRKVRPPTRLTPVGDDPHPGSVPRYSHGDRCGLKDMRYWQNQDGRRLNASELSKRPLRFSQYELKRGLDCNMEEHISEDTMSMDQMPDGGSDEVTSPHARRTRANRVGAVNGCNMSGGSLCGNNWDESQYRHRHSLRGGYPFQQSKYHPCDEEVLDERYLYDVQGGGRRREHVRHGHEDEGIVSPKTMSRSRREIKKPQRLIEQMAEKKPRTRAQKKRIEENMPELCPEELPPEEGDDMFSVAGILGYKLNPDGSVSGPPPLGVGAKYHRMILPASFTSQSTAKTLPKGARIVIEGANGKVIRETIVKGRDPSASPTDRQGTSSGSFHGGGTPYDPPARVEGNPDGRDTQRSLEDHGVIDGPPYPPACHTRNVRPRLNQYQSTPYTTAHTSAKPRRAPGPPPSLYQNPPSQVRQPAPRPSIQCRGNQMESSTHQVQAAPSNSHVHRNNPIRSGGTQRTGSLKEVISRATMLAQQQQARQDQHMMQHPTMGAMARSTSMNNVDNPRMRPSEAHQKGKASAPVVERELHKSQNKKALPRSSLWTEIG
ncbi:hypothetical protein BSKO_07567 [Bryopsis sp. KO-2023]|nr:hypothetical protein BSKO_07567 [Bryopsis sp. KO-2023]